MAKKKPQSLEEQLDSAVILSSLPVGAGAFSCGLMLDSFYALAQMPAVAHLPNMLFAAIIGSTILQEEQETFYHASLRGGLASLCYALGAVALQYLRNQ